MKRMMIQDVIDYIDSNIEHELTIEELSEVASYSRFYLHRVFDLLIGMSVMNYVRLRKMQHARAALSHGTRVIDVALMVGYQSERSFRRAFQQVFKLTPSHVKHDIYHTPEKIQFKYKKGMTMIHYLSETSLVSCEAFYAVGVKVVSKEPENESIQKMTSFKHEHHIDPITEIGMDADVSTQDSDQGKRGYLYYLVVDKETYDSIQDPSLIKKEVQASRYLRLTIDEPFKDPFERIPMGWKKLVLELESKYQHRSDLSINCFEEKVQTMTGTIMNLYVAIQ